MNMQYGMKIKEKGRIQEEGKIEENEKPYNNNRNNNNMYGTILSHLLFYLIRRNRQCYQGQILSNKQHQWKGN